MHDYKYDAVVRGNPNWGRDIKVQSLALKSISDAFVENIMRTFTFAFMPAMLASSVRRQQLWVDCIELEKLGTLNPDFFKFAGAGPAGMNEGLAKMLAAFNKANPDEKKVQEYAGQVGIAHINVFLADENNDAMRESMEALLSSVILESWTAFESLASDMWIVAVNTGPKDLAAKVALSKELQKPDEQIKPDTIHNLEYDPRVALGSFLHETGRVSFQKLAYIKLYYVEAFGLEIGKLFDKVSDGYIYALSAYRNALVHSAGRADKHFVRNVARFSELRGIESGSKLLLDGALAKKLRESAIFLGTELIHFADKAITPANP